MSETQQQSVESVLAVWEALQAELRAYEQAQAEWVARWQDYSARVRSVEAWRNSVQYVVMGHERLGYEYPMDGDSRPVYLLDWQKGAKTARASSAESFPAPVGGTK